MPTIIVCTDFSETSRNALSFTCHLAKEKAENYNLEILLLHTFSIPANYAGEGLSLITINDVWTDAAAKLEAETGWVKEEFPALNCSSKLTNGTLLKSLQEQVDELSPSFIVIGASGDFGDLWSWNDDILDLLRDATVPVLVVPDEVSFAPIQNIGYACNLRNVNPATPFETIKKWVRFTDATLHILSVAMPDEKKEITEQNQALVHEKLNELAPEYHTVSEAKVVGAIGHFVKEHHIDLLFVTPRRQGVWQALFHKSHTKELMRLNSIPILALHGG